MAEHCDTRRQRARVSTTRSIPPRVGRKYSRSHIRSSPRVAAGFQACRAPASTRRFGDRAPRFSRARPDFSWVGRTISRPAPALRRIYEQMMTPSGSRFGTSRAAAGFLRQLHTVPGLDKSSPATCTSPVPPPRGSARWLMLLQTDRPGDRTPAWSARTIRCPACELRRATISSRSAKKSPPQGRKSPARPGAHPEQAVHASDARTPSTPIGYDMSKVVLEKLKTKFGASVLETHQRFRRRHRRGHRAELEGRLRVPAARFEP